MKATMRLTALLAVLLLALAACSPGGGTPSATQPVRTSAPDKTTVPAQQTPVEPQPTVWEDGGVRREIEITTPIDGETVNNPVGVSGSVTVSPFEATLNGRIYAADGTLLGEGPIMVNAEMGQPGTFNGNIPFREGYAGPATIEIAELSAEDGSVMASDKVEVVVDAGGETPDNPTGQQITIDTPPAGAVIGNPINVTGSVAISPFEATLNGRVYDAAGNLLGEGPIMVNAEMGQPGTFSGSISYQAGYTGPGKIQISDLSAKDGSVIASASVDVTIGVPASDGGQVENIILPAAGAKVALPLHIVARLGQPGDRALVTLRWEDGTELRQEVPVVEGADGGGLIIGSLDWQTESQPPQPPERTAALEIDVQGVMAGVALEVLRWDDPELQQVELHWKLGESYEVETRNIPKTQAVARTALEELLWGPGPNNMADFETALPTPQEVLTYQGREADWGDRVTVLGLKIENGVATADFSKELRAYGGGSARVQAIREQITRTLKQFDNVEEVVIAIEGQTEGVLEP